MNAHGRWVAGCVLALGLGLAQVDAAVIWQGTAPQSASGVDSLAWLTGCWSRARPNGEVEEHWMKPAGGSLMGMSRTVQNGQTSEYEFLMIRAVNGKLAYVAKPSGQAEATFPLKSMTDKEVVFEDLAHDFPQRIIYRRNADGTITARIEGTLPNGQVRAVDFPFTRCGVRS